MNAANRVSDKNKQGKRGKSKMLKFIRKFAKKRVTIIIIGVLLLIILVMLSIMIGGKNKDTPSPEVVTVSTLREIVNISELSTYTSVYNGVANIYNEKKPENVDYYVSYKAKVNAGLDLSKVEITMDSEAKTITVKIPTIHITETALDETSLDYIFINKKANKSGVSATAMQACKADIESESRNQPAIIESAYTSAKNTLTALIKPIVDQLEGDYTLVIE